MKVRRLGSSTCVVFFVFILQSWDWIFIIQCCRTKKKKKKNYISHLELFVVNHCDDILTQTRHKLD